MSQEYTELQSPADQLRSQELSLKHARPPLEVAGYRMDRFLGAGAYGEVWVGIDRNTSRQVAIKFYAHKHGVDWSLLSREVEKLVFLSADRYVVQLLEVGWDSEPPYYVMEYLERGSLEDLLRTQGALPVNDAVTMFTEICHGLSHAHGKGVLHCDLKPANILLDQDHQPRLADFGQSRLSSEQTPALGTLFYMAPEQADLTAVPDARWDVYALGAILHCLLVGEPPFRSPEIVTQIDTATDLPDRLARYRQALQHALSPTLNSDMKHVDRALLEIMERCLAYEPAERYANVQEVLNALEARQRARQMRPVLAFGFAFPLLMLAVMTFFGWRGYQRALADTESLAVRRAVVNNQFAAQLAAERVAAEIERYFDIVYDEAYRSSFNDYFDLVLKNTALKELSRVDLAPKKLEELQDEFIANSVRKDLDIYLARRIKRYAQQPKLASIFVLNAEGVMLAAAFEGDERSQSVAKNFAYRTYFHGGATDLPKETRVPAVRPVDRPHLSAVFQSSTTKKWKVAIARPIWRSDPVHENEDIIAGLLVITLNLGDFEFFKSVQIQGEDRFAVLVDARPGNNTGSILQHPLFDQVLARGESLPETFQELRVPLLKDGTLAENAYGDPLGNDPLGALYAREWLAAAAPVRNVNGDKNVSTAGLVVLVQEDYVAVINPVRELGRRLVREGILALTVVVLVTVLLWLFVLRIVRETRMKPALLVPTDRMRTPHYADTTLELSLKQK
jgi:eukaryotic-like serine/threonine-protein kinase